MKAAIPRSRKMMTRSQMRPMPHIIAIGMSVICIMFERRLIGLRNRAQGTREAQFRCSSPRDCCRAALGCVDIREARRIG